MRTILVDDEMGARGYLRTLLQDQDEVDIIAEADHPLEAIRLINSHDPDLVFLDIQMPLMDGFDLLPYLKTKPIIIFCTAHDQYALKAFEVSALDYLLKPVTPERLEAAMKRAQNRWESLSALSAMPPRPEGLRKIICHHGGSYHVVWLRDVAAFKKDGRYTAVHTTAGSAFLTDLTLDYLEDKIVHPDFFRINRGAILRKDQIRRFQVQTYSSGEVETNLNETMTVSRSRLQDFKQWFFGS